jgi:hypothetical protein
MRGMIRVMRRLFVVAVCLGLASCADPPADQPRSEPGPAASDRLEIRCDGTSTDVVTPIVQAQADGVHVVVDNVSGGDVLTRWESGGDGAGPGRSTQVLPIPPGEGRFRCLPGLPDVDPGAPGGWATFEVLPIPDWISPEIDCPGGTMNVGTFDFIAGAHGVADPLEDARERAARKEVRQAGYATMSARTFVAFERTRPTMSFDYVADGSGGWLLSGTTSCG